MSLVSESERARNHKIPFIRYHSYLSQKPGWSCMSMMHSIHITGCVVSQSDCQSRVGGGAVLYLHKDIPAISSESVCALFTVFHSVKMCIAAVYCPQCTSIQLPVSFEIPGFLNAFLMRVCVVGLMFAFLVSYFVFVFKHLQTHFPTRQIPSCCRSRLIIGFSPYCCPI